MKISILLNIFFLNQIIYITSSENESPDPFNALGIPPFKLDEFAEKKKDSPAKLESLDDLPRFVQSGSYNSGMGLKLLTKFLTEDDDDLKEKGGVYDETGQDGLDSTEEAYPEGTEMRQRQRARSTAALFLKQLDKKEDFEAYGATPDKEKVDGWLTYVVLLMNGQGQHKLIKACIPEGSGVITFAMETNQLCKDRIGLAKSLQQRGQSYFQQAGFGDLNLPSLSKTNNKNNQNTKPKINDPPQINHQQQIKHINDKRDNKKQTEELKNENIQQQKGKQHIEQQELQQVNQQVEQKLEKKNQQQVVPKKEQSNLVKLSNLKKKNVSSIKQETQNKDTQEVKNLKNEVQELKDQLSELKDLLKQSVQQIIGQNKPLQQNQNKNINSLKEEQTFQQLRNQQKLKESKNLRFKQIKEKKVEKTLGEDQSLTGGIFNLINQKLKK